MCHQGRGGNEGVLWGDEYLLSRDLRVISASRDQKWDLELQDSFHQENKNKYFYLVLSIISGIEKNGVFCTGFFF